MRASQEGHADVVELLLQHDCSVNRRNDERMSALMLCSQRGHTKVVKMLIKAGAEIDVVTNQNSTALMLAVKRRHLDTAKMLVASGAELKIKDSKDRTALETAQKRGLVEIAEILTSDAQVKFMQIDSRRVRNFVMVRIWNLLQAERAHIKILGNEISIHKITGNLDNPILHQLCPSKRALVCAMTMPAPAFELITSFVPLPLLYEKRLQLLGSRAQIDPDSAVSETMDLIDEVLEEGGLMQAFDQAQVAPPCSFTDWVSCHEFALFTCAIYLTVCCISHVSKTAFQNWCGQCDAILSRRKGENSGGANALDQFHAYRDVAGTAQDQRRSSNYLHVIAHAPPSLSQILVSCPYRMPAIVLNKLINAQDIQSLVRKQAGVHFDSKFCQLFVVESFCELSYRYAFFWIAAVAIELVTLARMVVNWCESLPTF